MQTLLLALLSLSALVTHSSAAAPRRAARPSPELLRDDTLCLGCHSPVVDPEKLYASAHRTLACVDCHRGIEAVPHATRPVPVNCDRCHYQHPRRQFLGPEGAAELQPPIHELAAREGTTGLPTCTTCHGAHEVRPASDWASSRGKLRALTICAACHARITGEYRASVHGQALVAGAPGVPTCSDCHPEHPRGTEEGGPDILRGGVVTTCGFCHDDPGLQRRYALPGNRLASYLGSYHGTAAQLGDVRTANCVTCHGHHNVLPSTDPQSSIHPRNLPRTCGECHPGVNENVARGKVHVLATPESGQVLYCINLGFRWFTFAIIGALVGHIGLDLFGRCRRRRGD